MANPYYDPNDRDESDYAGRNYNRSEREGSAWGWLWILFLVLLLGLAFSAWNGNWMRSDTASTSTPADNNVVVTDTGTTVPATTEANAEAVSVVGVLDRNVGDTMAVIRTDDDKEMLVISEEPVAQNVSADNQRLVAEGILCKFEDVDQEMLAGLSEADRQAFAGKDVLIADSLRSEPGESKPVSSEKAQPSDVQ